jgi:hypothetical protein
MLSPESAAAAEEETQEQLLAQFKAQQASACTKQEESHIKCGHFASTR